MRAEIISIGHELLMGEVVDTNSAFLASQLPTVGLRVHWMSQVGDDLDHLTEILSRALQRSQVTLTTGGLGPTGDDLTREAIARVVGEEVWVDEQRLEALRTWFRGRGYQDMPSGNVKQAYRIPSSTFLPNPLGTAPGWWVEKDSRIIVAMPGPPHELKYMWEHEVRPRLAERNMGTVILTRTIKTFGLTEGDVDERVQELLGGENPYVGVYAKPDGIHVRVIAWGESQQAAETLLQSAEERIRQLVGENVWGLDDETPEERVGALLKTKGLTLAVMESCSGGMLAHTITEVPGSSSYFLGGIVSYATDVKVSSGVAPQVIEKHGVVSEETALAMAESVRRRLGAAIGIGITGVAGPDPQEEKEPGIVFIGIAHPGGTRVIRGRYPPRRHLVKTRAAVAALLGLWQELQKLP